MYKIDRRGGWGQKSYTRTDPPDLETVQPRLGFKGELPGVALGFFLNRFFSLCYLSGTHEFPQKISANSVEPFHQL